MSSYIFYFASCFPGRTHLNLNSFVYYVSRVKSVYFPIQCINQGFLLPMKHFLFLLFESLFKTKDLKYEKKQRFRSQILNTCLILGSVTFSHSHKKNVTPVKMVWVFSIFVSSSELIPAWIDNMYVKHDPLCKACLKVIHVQGTIIRTILTLKVQIPIFPMFGRTILFTNTFKCNPISDFHVELHPGTYINLSFKYFLLLIAI